MNRKTRTCDNRLFKRDHKISILNVMIRDKRENKSYNGRIWSHGGKSKFVKYPNEVIGHWNRSKWTG